MPFQGLLNLCPFPSHTMYPACDSHLVLVTLCYLSPKFISVRHWPSMASLRPIITGGRTLYVMKLKVSMLGDRLRNTWEMLDLDCAVYWLAGQHRVAAQEATKFQWEDKDGLLGRPAISREAWGRTIKEQTHSHWSIKGRHRPVEQTLGLVS